MPRGKKITDDSREKQALAAALRADGYAWPLVAQGAGYGSPSAARAAVQLYWRDQPDQDPAELRREMLGELESMELVLDRLENAEYVKITPQGNVARDDRGAPLVDPDPAFKAIQLRLAVQKRKAELFGTDAPRRTAADVKITPPELPAHLQQLLEETDAGG